MKINKVIRRFNQPKIVRHGSFQLYQEMYMYIVKTEIDKKTYMHTHKEKINEMNDYNLYVIA